MTETPVTDVPSGWPPPRTRVAMAALLEDARRRDPIGHHVHTALAAIYVLLLVLTTAPKDIAFAILLVYALMRMPHTWRTYTFLVRDPMGALLIGWGLWQGISLAWSADRGQGLEEWRACRVLFTVIAIWPVVTNVAWLIGAMLVGVLAQNVVQLLQHLEWFGLAPGMNGRLRGLLHPIHTATICTMAMCWHLSAMLHRPGALRFWLFAAGLVAASVGLVFTGSRGPWIAAGVALPFALVVTALRRPPARRVGLVLIVAAVVGGVAAWPSLGPFVAKRVEQARVDLAAAESGDYDTHVGLRLAMWRSAWRAFREAPIGGVGTGGYGEAAGRDEHAALLSGESHAHSMYMHVLACNGLVGVGLLAGVIVIALARGWRDPPDHLFADGNLPALIAWLVGAMFDAYQLTGQLFGVLLVLMVVTTPLRPDARERSPSVGDGKPAGDGGGHESGEVT
jgi:O-antigen ligase